VRTGCALNRIFIFWMPAIANGFDEPNLSARSSRSIFIVEGLPRAGLGAARFFLPRMIWPARRKEASLP